MKVVPVIDPRSPAQVDRYWMIAWRLRLASNAKAKAAAARLAEWHATTDKGLPALLRRQAA